MWRVDRWGISELLAVNNAIRRLPSTADVVAVRCPLRGSSLPTNCWVVVAENRRLQDRDSQEWSEAVSYFDVVAWGPPGEHTAQSFGRRGCPAQGVSSWHPGEPLFKAK